MLIRCAVCLTRLPKCQKLEQVLQTMIMSRKRLLLVWCIFFTTVVLVCIYLPYHVTNSKVYVAQPNVIYIHNPTHKIQHHHQSMPIEQKTHETLQTKPTTITEYKPTTCSSTRACIPDQELLVGPVYINRTAPLMKEIVQQESVEYGGAVTEGGAFKPRCCTSKNKLAIVIPYRNRSEHLRIFLRHMHPIMQRQMHEYRMIVVEQAGNYSFNRAALLNIGFLEALKLSKFECFVFHDVDHILENDQNDYGCPESPKLLAVSVDRFRRRWPYKRYFGGVGAFSKEQYEKINGYSNLYWGWGGEDDDAYQRIRAAGYTLARSSANHGRYIMLKKHHVRAKAGQNRYILLKSATKRMYTDGLNSVRYDVLKITEHPLYTHILAKLHEEFDVAPNITLATTKACFKRRATAVPNLIRELNSTLTRP